MGEHGRSLGTLVLVAVIILGGIGLGLLLQEQQKAKERRQSFVRLCTMGAEVLARLERGETAGLTLEKARYIKFECDRIQGQSK